MKFDVVPWAVIQLYERRNRIHFPVYQRGDVWSENHKAELIDSILIGLDIPKLYFERKNEDEWNCIDGHQRFDAIVGFLDGDFTYKDEKYEDLSDEQKKIIEDYQLTIAEVSDISEEQIRLLFKRLQLGVPLNSGEKLNAISSNMREFVNKMTGHPFIRNVNVPERRFAKEQVCAQICNNSIYLNKTGDYKNSKYEDLENLYRAYKAFDLNSREALGIFQVLNELNSIFGLDAGVITNRASVVSIYLFVEQLIIDGKLLDNRAFVREFYLKFNEELKKQIRLGLDATNRSLVLFYSKIIQAADSKASISFRHIFLHAAFTHFLLNKTIIGE